MRWDAWHCWRRFRRLQYHPRCIASDGSRGVEIEGSFWAARNQHREKLMAISENQALPAHEGFLARLRAATGQPLAAADAFGESFVLSRLSDAVQWARKYSFFPYPF